MVATDLCDCNKRLHTVYNLWSFEDAVGFMCVGSNVNGKNCHLTVCEVVRTVIFRYPK